MAFASVAPDTSGTMRDRAVPVNTETFLRQSAHFHRRRCVAALVGLEAVVLLDAHPGELPAPPGQLVTSPRQLLFIGEQLTPGREPLLAGPRVVIGHLLSPL